jgi:RHS repeat-associated protein
MKGAAKISLFVFCSCFLLLRTLNSYAGIESYVKYLNGPFVAGHSFFSNKDNAFENPAYTWSTINNLTVQDVVTLRVADSVLISTSFSCTLTLNVKYYTNPDTVGTPPVNTPVNLTVSYVPGQGITYNGLASYTFTGAYQISVTVTAINNYGTTPPGLSLQLGSSITINRKYAFQPTTNIFASFTPAHSSAQMTATWPTVIGAEQYDLEWTTINDGNDYFAIIDTCFRDPGHSNPAVVTAALSVIFRNNATRVTTSANSYTVSLLSSDTLLLFRIRQVQYLPNGVRQAGNWSYMQSGGTLFSIFALAWHQPNLDWQYSSAYAEDGKKKEVVSYFDGTLRGRQTVTLDNTDNIALAQENIYDEFGRPAASILPAPFVDSSGTAYLHYNLNFNKNSTGNSYNYKDIDQTIGTYCEWKPDPLNTISGASRYYSTQNDFYNHGSITGQKAYNSFIPADTYPISLTQYTADNTGRIKIQGGVGSAFQPGEAVAPNASRVTKYYYGKPDQGELDMLFGNDVGFAEHYLKNMVIDPNGQISVSYINASGKTIATALAGHAPSNLDTLPSYHSVTSATKVQTLHILKPQQFIYNSTGMTLSATTTYLNAVIDTGRLAFSMQQLVDNFPGGTTNICSNCYYLMTVTVTDDCGDIVASTATPVQIGSDTSDCSNTALYQNSIPVNFAQIGEYNVSIVFAFSQSVINQYADSLISKGIQQKFIQQQTNYVKNYYLENINASGCYSDCQTCSVLLGTQAAFVQKVKADLVALELDSATVAGSSFTGWADTLYNNLKDSCAAAQAHCDYNPCEGTQDLMIQDVSPGGQYAQFNSNGTPVDPKVNVLNNYWRTVFPVKPATDPAYQANLVTLNDSTVTSPYDINFKLSQLVAYWQPKWALSFLQYHPEYCLLKFCNSMSSFKNWDAIVQQYDEASQVPLIPGASGLQFKYTNSSAWLLAADPFFKSGAPGYAFYSQMSSDLLHYSVNILGIDSTTASNKGVIQMGDYNLYCNVPAGSTTNTGTGSNWNGCAPAISCRVPNREWQSYRDLYLAVKQKYYNILQSDSCGAACSAGTPVSFNLPGTKPQFTDFTIAADTGQTAACTGQQSAVVYRNSYASLASDTVIFYYPPEYDNSSLVHHIVFNTGDIRKAFCVPDSIPLSAILVNNPAVLQLDTPSVRIVDAFVKDTTCSCTSCPNSRIIRKTHLVLLNKHGQPTISAGTVEGNLYYVYNYHGGSGYPPSLSIPLNITPGDSTSNIFTYSELDYESFGGTMCYQVNLDLSCINFIIGSRLATTGFTTTCAGYTDSVPQPTCPQSISIKQSRFPTYQNNASSVTSTSSLITSAKTSIAQQAGDVCTGNVNQLMTALTPGLDSIGASPSQIAVLQGRLLTICEAGADSAHSMGVSDVYGDPNHGATTYLRFRDPIKALINTLTSSTYFLPNVNPWLTEGPFPYLAQQQTQPKVISNSTPALCTLLSTLEARAVSAGYGTNLYGYLVAYYQGAMTLSLNDLDSLQKSCTNCKFIIPVNVTLPVFLDPTAKGCIKRTDFVTAVDSLGTLFNHNLSTSDPRYQTIYTNFLNQRWGFALGYQDYVNYSNELVTDTAAILCNTAPFAVAAIDSSDCLYNTLATAVASGKAGYDVYIDSIRTAFETNYVSTCKLAQANATMTAVQQTYHYTLYYYDQADNLVRTVPPEGVTLIDSSQFNLIDAKRVSDTSFTTFSYNGPTTAANLTTALTTLSSTLSAAHGAVEMWLYNGGKSNYHWVEATPDRKYLFQVGLSGTNLSIDIYPMNGSTGNYIQFTPVSKHYNVNISANLPLLPFTHVVIQGDTLGSATVKPSIYVNGVARSVTTTAGASPFGFTVTAGSTSVTFPDSIEDLKHLILYNHTLTGTVISEDASDLYFNAHDLTYTGWYRFNVPAVGQPPTTVNDTTSDETTAYGAYPAHVLTTNYNYNSTNQVSTQLSPDGGTNRYWYDLLSRLTVSQNDKQLPLNEYSYTVYDTLGRITEVGQKLQTTIPLGSPHYLTNDTIGYFYNAGTNSQITDTYYDSPASGSGIATVLQNNLRKRVAASTYTETAGSPVENATYYTYDIDGNVQTLWQQVNGLYTSSGLKRIDYEYDLISGKVNFVRYQDKLTDAFYYSYQYDADNRLTDAWSGTLDLTDTLIHSTLITGNGRKDAHYYYYLHGPLARVELGDTTGRVQGVDYAYTLQGWLKGVNDTRVQSSTDMGKDSLHVARDAYGYALYYYASDYTPIGGSNPFDTAPTSLASFSGLYNGNIAAMSTNIKQLTDPWHYYTYTYDQLNRIRANSVYKVTSPTVNTAVTDYHETFTYDGNGNIQNVLRNMNSGVAMDKLNYQYNLSGGKLINNRLNYITDSVTTHTYPYGLDNQALNNYTYDAIGNMTADVVDTVSNILWNVYGHIQSLNNSKGTLTYTYDAAGQRVTKNLGGITTYYIRDAQGNTLALYDNTHSVVNWKEQDLYGSSRLGMWQPNISLSTGSGITAWDTIGKKQLELTNHLGNVWVTITDKRIQHSTNGTTVDYFNADVATAQEYYAFGGLMPSRTYTYLKNYRYGFNGKENDNDVQGTGRWQDYGERTYLPLVGRFPNIDPLTQKYPELSSYQFGSNSPISGIDLNGLEFEHYRAAQTVKDKGVGALKIINSSDGNGPLVKATYSLKVHGNLAAFEGLKYIYTTDPGMVHNPNNEHAYYVPLKKAPTINVGDNMKITVSAAYGIVQEDIYVRFTNVTVTKNTFNITAATLEGHTDAGFINFSGSFDPQTGTISFTIHNETTNNVGLDLIGYGRIVQTTQWKVVLNNVENYLQGKTLSKTIDKEISSQGAKNEDAVKTVHENLLNNTSSESVGAKQTPPLTSDQ